MFTASPGCECAEAGDRGGVRDDVHAESIALHLVHRQRYAVHGDAALDGDEPGERSAARGKPSGWRRFPVWRTAPRRRRPRGRRRGGRPVRRRCAASVPGSPGCRRASGRAWCRPASRPRRRRRTSPGRLRPRSGSSRNRRSRRRCAMLPVSGQGAAMTRRMSWPAPIGVMARTVPSAVTMPVNILSSTRSHLSRCAGEVAERSDAGEGPAARTSCAACPSPAASRRPLPRSGRGVLVLIIIPSSRIRSACPRRAASRRWRAKRGIASRRSMPNACTAGQPSPPITAGAWNQAMRSTRSARSSAAATCAPPSTSSRVSPALAERASARPAGRPRRRRRRPRSAATPSVGEGVGGAAASVPWRISIQVGVSRGGGDQARGQRRAQVAVGHDAHHRGGAKAGRCGRSGPGRRPAPCRRRPAPRRAGRAGRARRGGRPRR